jgi:hypothetical protein
LQRHNDVQITRKEPLVSAEDFAQSALQPVAHHGVAYATRCNHGEPRQLKTWIGRTPPHRKYKGRPKLAAAFLTHGRKIRLTAQSLPGAESHGRNARCRARRPDGR